MKHILILLSLSMFALADVFKLTSSEVYLVKDNETEEMVFYNLKENPFIGNEIKSCIVEEKNDEYKIYCVHKNLKTYYGKLDGQLTPDNIFYSFSNFLELEELELDLKPYSK